MQRHCNKEHDWYVSKRDPTHWNPVWVQTFFGGSNVRFFLVQVEAANEVSESAPASPASSDEGYNELRQKFLLDMEEGRKKDEEQKKILDAKMEKIDNTGW